MEIKRIVAAENHLFSVESFAKILAQYAKQVQMGTGVDPEKAKKKDPRIKLHNNLQKDAARFAAYREAQKERELKAAITEFDKAKITKKYKDYLAVEKQGIFANSAAAERWLGFAENADLYPNLEWRTAGDADVRAEHAILQGLILPVTDPFWNVHTPPLGFGCRCELIQTDEPANKKEGYQETTAPKGFDFNPGKEQKIFSDTAGYYTSATADDSKLIEEWLADFLENYQP
jgi:SPP1 gp7 family putative phage head morphogenesis protein